MSEQREERPVTISKIVSALKSSGVYKTMSDKSRWEKDIQDLADTIFVCALPPVTPPTVEEKPLSNCCNFAVSIPKEEFGDEQGYVCLSCGKSCDITAKLHHDAMMLTEKDTVK